MFAHWWRSSAAILLGAGLWPVWSLATPYEPYLTIESQIQWEEALFTGRVEPVMPPEWGDYMMQWSLYLDEGEPYPPHEFLPAASPTGRLYVYPGGTAAEDPEDAGLVMVWGEGPTPPGEYSSAWKYVYPLDPDLSNCAITVTVTPPASINVVSFGIQDALGNFRAWYWNVGPGGPLQPAVPNVITINTSATGVNATTPVASAYMSHPAFDLTQAVSFIFDENSTWVGSVPVPAPGTGLIASWNYWHNIFVTPLPGVVKWAQPPVYSDFTPFPQCFYGWDEPSLWRQGPIMADDFLCADDRPITDVHWWGSYQNWLGEEPPPGGPDFFRIGLWTDVPVGPANPLPFSHPGVLLKEWTVARTEVFERRAGCDFHPEFMPGPDTCFEYDYKIPVADWFWQPEANTVYWLSIAAEYLASPPCPCNGDVNGDGAINATDLAMVLANFGNPAACPPCDVNCDGNVDQADVTVIQCQFGQVPPGDPTCCSGGSVDPYLWGWKTRPHHFNDDAVRMFTPTAPAIGDAFMAGDPLEDAAGDSWDLAFVLTTDRPQPPPSELKWDQPPEPIDIPNVYYGWNEYSVWGPSAALGVLAADDWVCNTDDPVTKIRWWGSFIGWRDGLADPPLPSAFRIHIWTDVPAGAGTPDDFSHPGQVIHEIVCTNFTAQFVGWDYNPATREYEACYLFEQELQPNEYFYQQGPNTIYWLSIGAQYDLGSPQYPWGWKTRPRSPDSLAPDDAVRIFDPSAPVLGSSWVNGEPIFWPTREDSWDLAFELVALSQSSTLVKWGQEPDLAPTGIDVNAGPAPTMTEGFIVADDYRCTQTEPIVEFHIYGSWWHDLLPINDAGVPDPASVRFTLSIHEDIPDPDGTGPLYSMPGALLWRHTFEPGMFAVQEYASQLMEGWLRPPDEYEPVGDTVCWLYIFPVPPGQEFIQQGTTGAPIIYWVDVQAEPLSLNPEVRWGWKTTPMRFMDAAVWGIGADPYLGPWTNLLFPPLHPKAGQPIDLAFTLFSPIGVKWQRPPDLNPTGLDVEASILATVTPPPYVLADDFLCTHTGPITDFHIFGSWLDDYLPYGFDPTGVEFTLSIHDDIPASQSPTGYSMPGAVLWHQTFLPGEFGAMPYAVELQEGWLNPPEDYDPIGDTQCWRYDFLVLPTAAPFIQQEGRVYWLDVQARPLDPNAHFGWKTSMMHWNDDAVYGQGIEPYPGPWYELIYPPMHPQAGQSIDLAFLITTEAQGEPYIKWSQPPEPYVPDDAFNGWNEPSVYGGPQIAADDWVCTNGFPVTDIHFWGSFLGWAGTVMPQRPAAFHLGIWTDVPTNGTGDPDFSHPGELLWQKTVTEYSWRFVGWDWDPRAPQTPPEACFRFDVILPEEDWFLQPDGTNIFWLSIAAMPDPAGPNQHIWGWKTRPRDPLSPAPDDAVAILDPTAPVDGSVYGAGRPLYWPTPSDSWDLAFQLTTLPWCLEADVNCDGTVNAGDLLSIRAPGVWQSAGPPGWIRPDVNNDGIVNAGDLLSVRAPGTWQASTGPCNCGP